ncbi:hypothetical protein [Massilia sp.]|uniref:hypothetical protein n=1 Tax=Massilia sp. TaxID=1882437 RepID=UPI00352DEEDD
MPIRSRVVGIALCVACACGGARPLEVLGLPLGGHVHMPVRQCTREEARNDVQTLCVIDKLRAAQDGGQVYSLAVPDRGKRPEWAVDATIEANLLNDGEVKWFNVQTKDVNAYDVIEKSITHRFGKPLYIPKGSAISRDAEWYTPEVQVSLACVQKVGCYVHFSANDNAKGTKKQESAKAPSRPRPISP